MALARSSLQVALVSKAVVWSPSSSSAVSEVFDSSSSCVRHNASPHQDASALTFPVVCACQSPLSFIAPEPSFSCVPVSLFTSSFLWLWLVGHDV